ncbi:DUF1727 domain-containing protein [Candidatus Microgenomates bacterium]|nr:DUF1727 domain-containing protein [Candidatus Microgenomates bacterium]
MIDPDLIRHLVPHEVQVVLIAGTNGKTTTAKMLQSILGSDDVVINQSGANLVNGIAGTVLQNPRKKYYVFEVDEANLPKMISQVGPTIIVLTNLFRDQLDRYGEVDNIAKRWQAALTLYENTLVINADDPQLAFLGQNLKTKIRYFGLGDQKYFLPKMQHATDSIYCPNCGSRLKFSGVYFSHLGEYECLKCGFKHPKNDKTDHDFQMEGVYNKYNILAAELTAEVLGVKNPKIENFKPAFGRSEEIGDTKILLSKNPTGFNESIRTVLNSNRKGPILLVLNDRIPDGRDVSWIWDVDFEMLKGFQHDIFVSGDRALDLALRLKYAEVPFEIKHELKVSWILPTYSAMLDIRKELTGKKIL